MNKMNIVGRILSYLVPFKKRILFAVIILIIAISIGFFAATCYSENYRYRHGSEKHERHISSGCVFGIFSYSESTNRDAANKNIC